MNIKKLIAGIPVNNKYFLSFPCISCFKIKNTSKTPNKEKTTKGNKKSKDPFKNSLIIGTKNSLNIKIKTIISAQNVMIKDFSIILLFFTLVFYPLALIF